MAAAAATAAAAAVAAAVARLQRGRQKKGAMCPSLEKNDLFFCLFHI